MPQSTWPVGCDCPELFSQSDRLHLNFPANHIACPELLDLSGLTVLIRATLQVTWLRHLALGVPPCTPCTLWSSVSPSPWRWWGLPFIFLNSFYSAYASQNPFFSCLPLKPTDVLWAWVTPGLLRAYVGWAGNPRLRGLVRTELYARPRGSPLPRSCCACSVGRRTEGRLLAPQRRVRLLVTLTSSFLSRGYNFQKQKVNLQRQYVKPT